MKKILVFCIMLWGCFMYAEDPAAMIEKLKGPITPLGCPWEGPIPEMLSYSPSQYHFSPFALTEFLIDTSQYPVGALGSQRYPGIAFDGSNYMAVWMDYNRGIVGSRITTDGIVLDIPAFFISPFVSDDQPDIVFDGTNYFIVWAVAPNIYGVRIKPDGTVLDPNPILISNTGTYTPAVAYGVGVYLVVWEYSGGGYFDALAALVDTSGAVLLDFPLGDDPVANECWPNASFNGTNFLAVWYIASVGECGIMGSRITPDGTNLDPGGFHITYQTGNGDATPQVVFDGTNWFVVFTRMNLSWLGYAWVTPDGVPFGEADIPGGGGLVFPEVVLGDSVYWVEAIDVTDPNIYAARIDFQGNVLDNPWIPVDTSTGWQAYGGDAYSDSTFIAIWEDQVNWDIYARRYAPDGNPLDSTRFVVNIGGSQHQYAPAIAFDGTDYLVVYHDDRQGGYGSYGWDIYGSRIAQDGTLLNPGGFLIHQGICNWPAVAFGDSLYLCVWQTRSGYDIWGARILTDGIVLDTNGFQITFGASIDAPVSVAYKNGIFLVTYYSSAYPGYGIKATRVAPDGQVLDPSGILIREPIIGTPYWPEVAPYGNGFLVTWQWNSNDDYIEGARVDFQGAVLDSPAIQISPPGVGNSLHGLASSGDTFFVVWDRDTTDIYGTRVDSSGTVLDPAGIPICSGQPNTRTQPSVAFNGKDFLVVWQDSRQDNTQYDIYGARVSPAGVVLDTNGIELINAEYSRGSIELASATPDPDTGARMLLVFDGFMDGPYNANRALGAIYYPPVGITEGYTQKMPAENRFDICPSICHMKPFALNYSLSERSEIAVNVYDVDGRLVKDLCNSNLEGTGKIVFTLEEMPQGIYFARVAIGNKVATTKLIWLK